MPTTPEAWQRWFEKIWEHREEQVYRAFFENLGEGILTVPPQVFERLGAREIDPRWLTHGVFECPPVARRDNWLYVTSALSNPWGQDPATADRSGFSGLGMEFVIQAPERASWAVGVLHWLTAVQILVASGLYQGGLLEYYDRIPLGTSIDPGRPSALRNLILAEPQGFPARFQLESGQVGLMLCVGVTDDERDFAARKSGPELVTLLQHRGVFPLTDPSRGSVL